ncbi:porin [Hydromonas duriensis]|nr:porin [Hydromonas duriensis]
MKKSLLALAVLASAAGAANAASSVTLYGRVDVGYEKWSGSSLTQAGAGETRLGIKGQEDLGNGLAATFQLEGRFDADTGAKTSGKDFFDRESTVGLKGNFGHVRFGRSKSAMERALGDYAPGERVATAFDPYSSNTRHSNGMFYDFAMNGFNFGFDVTTKGGATGNTNEGADGQKVGYGIHAGYQVGGFRVNAAYQADKNGTGINSYNTATVGQNVSSVTPTPLSSTGENLTFGSQNEWGLGMAYKYKMVEFGATYARAESASNAKVTYALLDSNNNIAALSSVTGKQRLTTLGAYITADVTSNDSVYARYLEKRGGGTLDGKAKVYALGYSHALSKRTSIYADVARYKNDDSTTAYDIALRHAF